MPTKTIDLGTKSIPKLVLSYLITALIGMTMNTVYNLTDTLFISRGVGDIAMGGVAIVLPFVTLQSAVSTMIGGGAATIVSIKLGEKQFFEAGRVTQNAMFLFYSIATVITIVGLVFRDSIISILGATTEIFVYAKDYFTVLLIGNVFSTGFSSIIRAEGKNVYAMLIWIVPISINIALDALFVLGMGLGVKGAALATVISQFTSFLFCIMFFAKFSSQKFSVPKIKLSIIKDICKIGMPVLAQISAFSIITMVANIVLGREDDATQIIAFGYVSKVAYYVMTPFLALSQAISPIISYNYAQTNRQRVASTLKISFVFVISYSVVCLILLLTLSKCFIMIFTKDLAIVQIAENGLKIVAFSLFFTAVIIIIGTRLQAVKRTVSAVIVNLSSSIIAVLLMILLQDRLTQGVYIAYTLSYALGCVGTIFAIIIRHILHNQEIPPIC